MSRLAEEYIFPETVTEIEYRLFPSEMENDRLVFFHGTEDAKREAIFREGFKCPGGLDSVSFSTSSALALDYACKRRHSASPDGCVIAVRFDEIDPSWDDTLPGGVIHLRDLSNQPAIVGYCVVPASYKHI